MNNPIIEISLPRNEWLFLETVVIVMQIKYERKRKDKEMSRKIAKRLDGIRKVIIGREREFVERGK